MLWINGFVGASPTFDHIARIVASDYLMPLAFSAVIFAIWFVGRDLSERRRYQRGTLLAATAIGISNLIVDIIDSAYDRQRPFDELGDSLQLIFYRSTDPSFPANPMAVVFAIATGVWLVDRRIGWTLMAGATIYSVVRVYVGTFYPTDVIGGAVIGVISALIAWLLFEILKPVPELFLRLLRGIGIA
ncbi:MAG: phosphatase PAP2 family protein [Chloroflexi bacterium]|nr:phosphatase PAP2 family protein [Chloroflexota bacterium]